MGFAVIMTQIIFFSLIIVGLSIMTVEKYHENMKTAESKSIQSSIKQTKAQANITLISSSYDDNSAIVSIVIQNNGPTAFFPDQTDTYFNGTKIDRNSGQFYRFIDVDVGNPNMVDPGEQLRVEHKVILNAGEYNYTVVDPFGASITTNITYAP